MPPRLLPLLATLLLPTLLACGDADTSNAPLTSATAPHRTLTRAENHRATLEEPATPTTPPKDTVHYSEHAYVQAPASHQAMTALQKHVHFFDRDNDGFITLSNTYDGLRALGFGSVASSGMAVAINGALGPSTGATWFAPFTINIGLIHHGKHGSDTGVYDAEGHYNANAFEAMFELYDSNEDAELSEEEFEDLYEGQYTDSSGSNASRAEFSILFQLASTTRTRSEEVAYGDSWSSYTTTEEVSYQVLTRETLESFYDGSLFYELAGEAIPD